MSTQCHDHTFAYPEEVKKALYKNVRLFSGGVEGIQFSDDTNSGGYSVWIKCHKYLAIIIVADRASPPARFCVPYDRVS